MVTEISAAMRADFPPALWRGFDGSLSTLGGHFSESFAT